MIRLWWRRKVDPPTLTPAEPMNSTRNWVPGPDHWVRGRSHYRCLLCHEHVVYDDASWLPFTNRTGLWEGHYHANPENPHQFGRCDVPLADRWPAIPDPMREEYRKAGTEHHLPEREDQ